MHTFAGLQQEEYRQLIEATLEGKDFSKLPFTHPARAYKSIADRISVSKAGTTDVAMLDSTRIIVPPNAVQSIMKELHRAHSGIEKMYKTAVQLYFWPGMKNIIKQAVDTWEEMDRPSRPILRLRMDASAEKNGHSNSD